MREERKLQVRERNGKTLEGGKITEREGLKSKTQNMGAQLKKQQKKKKKKQEMR